MKELFEDTDIINAYNPFKGLKALSIRQPFAWLIAHGGKDIENRDWITRFRGDVLIHAGQKRCTRDDVEAIEKRFACHITMTELHFGGIVAVATITDCVEESRSKWFVGSYGFVLSNVRPLPFRPCKGALGFFVPRFD